MIVDQIRSRLTIISSFNSRASQLPKGASHRPDRHRLNLLHMYDELNERWHRMDALNAGLEEAVRSKTTLQASVASAELLLVKQVWGRSMNKHMENSVMSR